MTKEKNKRLRKGGRLPLFSNLPDVRLYHNRFWPPFTPKSWAVNQKENSFKYSNDNSDE